MRIHSSSLTLTPVGFNRQTTGKQISAQHKDDKKESYGAIDTTADNQVQFPSRSPELITQIPDIAGPGSNLNATDNFVPRDKRILRALTAYSRELSQPLQDQRAVAVKGIDLYA